MTPPSTPTAATITFKVKPPKQTLAKVDYKLVEDTTIRFTQKAAFALLELDTFEGERKVIEQHVQDLYIAHRAGRFMWEHVVLGRCECQGKLYRLNGQHTAWMRVNLDDTKDLLGVQPSVRQITYTTKHIDDMKALYATFDRAKARTPSHLFRMMLTGNDAVKDVWPSIINVVGVGMKLWLYETPRQRQIDPAELTNIVESRYSMLFKAVSLFIQQHYQDGTSVRRSPVVAAMFATFEANPSLAGSFWTPVMNGLGLNEKTDPRYALRKYLSSHSQTTGNRDREPVSAEDIYRVCIVAWNKWRASERVLGALRPTDDRWKVRK